MGIIKYRTDASSPWVEIPALQGRTPVKREDYWTEEDKQEIIDEVASSIDIPEVDLSGYALKEHEHEQYLTEHQSLEGYAKTEDIPSLDGYATEEYVQEKIGEIEIPEVDLDDYATIFYVDEAVASIDVPEADLTGYATEKYVDDKVAAIDVPEVDLNGYAKTSEVSSALAGKADKTHSHNEYATTLYVDGAVAAVPKYDLTPYATKTYVQDAVDSLPEYDLTPYALKKDIPDTNTLATKLYVQTELAKVETGDSEVDLTGYATEEWVTEQIEAIEFPETDLSGYAKTSYVNTALAEKADVTHVHTEYAAKNHSHEEYLTEHQDLSGYALKSHTHSEYLTEHQSLEGYAKLTDIPDVSAFQTETQVQALIDASLGVIENGTY